VALQAEGILDSLSGRLSQLGSLQIETLPVDNSVNQLDSPKDLPDKLAASSISRDRSMK
jgi:hypothetical protein